MNNAESNESQDKQGQRAAESPMKKPATETAHAHPHDVANAAAAGDSGQPRAPAESISRDERAGDSPIQAANERREGIDVLNDGTLDNTVDADGKNRDATRDMEMRQNEPDSVIQSNATLDNYVFEQGDGLGGFDSRPGRSGLLLALERGFSLVDKGMVAPAVVEIEEKLRFDGRDAHGHVLRGRKHYALNHMRPSRLIELNRDK